MQHELGRCTLGPGARLIEDFVLRGWVWNHCVGQAVRGGLERAEGPPTLWSSIGRQLFRSQRVPHTLKYERAARVCSSASSTPLLLNNALRRKKFANTAQFFL